MVEIKLVAISQSTISSDKLNLLREMFEHLKENIMHHLNEKEYFIPDVLRNGYFSKLTCEKKLCDLIIKKSNKYSMHKVIKALFFNTFFLFHQFYTPRIQLNVIFFWGGGGRRKRC